MAEEKPRKIIHFDLDAFFCAVEELRNPALKGKPFAVGGKPGERGVVASCSYPARRCGVRSAMPTARAIRLCPELIITPPRHGIYGEVSRQVMERLYSFTALLEKVSIDEAFLDVSDLSEPPEVIARQIQDRIHRELDLPCSIGAATNKLVAKIANDVGKASNRSDQPPNAITVVPPGQEAAFLAPLPVEALWGVGPKTAERLKGLAIHTIGELAEWPVDSLVELFGKNGAEMAQRARGIDDNPIHTSHATKSVSQETTFAKDMRDRESLIRTLRELSEGVGRQLRKEQLCAATIKIKVRWPDFTTITRQVTLPQATDQDREIYEAALKLFEKVWKTHQAVRLLGVGASGLGEAARQLSFLDRDTEKDRKLQATLDQLRERYGDKVVRRGVKGK